MGLLLNIPDEVVWAIKLPKKQIESELIKEVAFTLYKRELTSMGIARRFANLSKWAFIESKTWHSKALLWTKRTLTMQEVVSNSSPLIHFAKIGQLNLLHEFFGRIKYLIINFLVFRSPNFSLAVASSKINLGLQNTIKFMAGYLLSLMLYMRKQTIIL